MQGETNLKDEDTSLNVERLDLSKLEKMKEMKENGEEREREVRPKEMRERREKSGVGLSVSVGEMSGLFRPKM